MSSYVYVMDDAYLMHHGIKGQHWGIRRYQKSDGSYTAEGLLRYGIEKGLNRAKSSAKARGKLLSQRAREYGAHGKTMAKIGASQLYDKATGGYRYGGYRANKAKVGAGLAMDRLRSEASSRMNSAIGSANYGAYRAKKAGVGAGLAMDRLRSEASSRMNSAIGSANYGTYRAKKAGVGAGLAMDRLRGEATSRMNDAMGSVNYGKYRVNKAKAALGVRVGSSDFAQKVKNRAAAASVAATLTRFGDTNITQAFDTRRRNDPFGDRYRSSGSSYSRPSGDYDYRSWQDSLSGRQSSSRGSYASRTPNSYWATQTSYRISGR